MKYIIREALLDDVKEINYLLTLLIRDEKQYDNNINEECVINYYYEQVIENDKVQLLVAIEDNKVVGYLYGYIENTGNTCINLVAKLDALFVFEEYRNLSIADKLIEEFKKWCKSMNVKCIRLSVWNENKKAIDLYQRHDFHDSQSVMTLEL